MPLSAKLIDPVGLEFVATTIDGRILEFPQRLYFKCDLVIPLYQQVVRQYDGNECINAIRVYMVSYGGHLYGTKDFTNMVDFLSYRNTSCKTKFCCDLIFNGCYVTIAGRRVTGGFQLRF